MTIVDNPVVSLKFAKRVELECSQQKRLGIGEVMDLLINSMGESFHSVYVYEVIT